MSRIGKNPVAIPQGVTVDLAGQTLTAKGRLGTLSLVVSNDVTATRMDVPRSFSNPRIGGIPARHSAPLIDRPPPRPFYGAASRPSTRAAVSVN